MRLKTILVGLLAITLLGCSQDPGANNIAVTNTSNNQTAASTTNDTTAIATTNNASPDVGMAQDAGGNTPADVSMPVENPLGEWCTGQPADFSFFVTSMDAMWKLSDSTPGDLNGGFGGDFGGLAGADQICQTIADATGFGDKTWHAFLSATDDGNGNQVDAIDRIGVGPWHDANGRLVASGIAGLAGDRPDGDAQSTADLPDECGTPTSILGDVHDTVTGSNKEGRLNNTNPDSTCLDWTSSDGAVGSTGGGRQGGTVMIGHSFPRQGGGGGPGGGGQNWVSDHPTRGCGKGANLLQNGAGEGTCIGCGGGYGGIYCFATE